MSQIILVNPRMCSLRSVRMPLSLLALGAVLEGRYRYHWVDGNVDDHATDTVLKLLAEDNTALVAVTVMPGPQIGPAIAISSAIRKRFPEVPIVWGGYFPTLYPDAAINAPYVDYVVRGQGEDTLLELLERLSDAGPPIDARHPGVAESAHDPSAVTDIRGITWKRDGTIVHNADRPFRPPDEFPLMPYERLRNFDIYLRPSFMGSRTAVHQAAIGCRYHCTFCGVVSMFNGKTHLQGVERLAKVLQILRHRYRADSVQFYDHNFFDREATSVPTLEVLARSEIPWWCYARADTLANFADSTWKLIERSKLRMAYIGAEAATDAVLTRMRKGTQTNHTLEAARRCREHRVIPEFSFVLGGPEDPEGEIERTFQFIKKLKRIHPTCEVILYFYSPTPQRDRKAVVAEPSGVRIPTLDTYGPDGPSLPTTPEEWTDKAWVDYVCHRDAPWLTPRIRQRVKDFAKVLSCRFPTAQDYSTGRLGKAVLKTLAAWRYASGMYSRTWELDLARRLVAPREPQRESI
jgi:anaerobic magnesium-protoporphyrin IX monomethyl ester cyclase